MQSARGAKRIALASTGRRRWSHQAMACMQRPVKDPCAFPGDTVEQMELRGFGGKSCSFCRRQLYLDGKLGQSP
jgi:hypothetical protein